MTKWNAYPDILPPRSGHYAVMIAGDSERDGAHVFYEFDDYQTFAVYSEGSQSFRGEHDEEDECVIAWFGPLEIPPCDVGTTLECKHDGTHSFGCNPGVTKCDKCGKMFGVYNVDLERIT